MRIDRRHARSSDSTGAAIEAVALRLAQNGMRSLPEGVLDAGELKIRI